MAYSNDVHPWERQPAETAQAFHAFAHYRDQPAGARSLRASYASHLTGCRGRPQAGHERATLPGRWRRWIHEHGWTARVGAYDAHLDAERRRRNEAEIAEMLRMHAMEAQALRFAAGVPVRLLIERIQRNDPDTMKELGAAGATRLLRLVSLLGPKLLLAQQSERLARGLETEAIRLASPAADKLPTLAEMISENPAAADALAELVERLTFDRGALPASDGDLTPAAGPMRTPMTTKASDERARVGRIPDLSKRRAPERGQPGDSRGGSVRKDGAASGNGGPENRRAGRSGTSRR